MASPKPQTRQAAEKRNPLTFPPVAKRQWGGPTPLKLAEELLESHQIPGGIVLDLGSGASITSALLARAYGFIVYTTDLWSAPGENMRFFESLGLTNRNVIPLRIDASEGLPFAECFFDAVVSIDSYSYFGRNPKYLDEKLLPYIKPGGYLYLAIPGMHKDCHDDLPSELLASWTPEQLDYMHDMRARALQRQCGVGLGQRLHVWVVQMHNALAKRQRRPGLAAPLGTTNLDCAEDGKQPLQAFVDKARAVRPRLFGSIYNQGLASLFEVGILCFRGLSNSIFEDSDTSFSRNIRLDFRGHSHIIFEGIFC